MEGGNHTPGLCCCALAVRCFLENVSQLLSFLPVFASSAAVAPLAVAVIKPGNPVLGFWVFPKERHG
jgi:hypothetical protein